MKEVRRGDQDVGSHGTWAGKKMDLPKKKLQDDAGCNQKESCQGYVRKRVGKRGSPASSGEYNKNTQKKTT